MKNTIPDSIVRLAARLCPPSIRVAWTQFKSLLLLAVTVVMFGSTPGCARPNGTEGKVYLAPAENRSVGDSFTLDDRVVGKLVALNQDPTGRCAVLRVTVRKVQILEGTERVSGTLRLSSANCSNDAQPIVNGAVIPTRAPLNHAALAAAASVEQWASRVRDFIADHPLIGIAAGVAVLILLVSLLCRCLRRACTVLMVIGLLAAAASAFAAPVKRDQVEAEIRKVEGLVARAEEFAAEARRLTKAGLVPSAQTTGIRAIFSCDRAADP
ncbi:MAG: hypothetical protein WCI73_07480, partial [Phycisphaerae bacterium]